MNKLEKALDLLIKGGGEGSRGGKVIGHTKSGKPIYESQRSGGSKPLTRESIIKESGKHVHTGKVFEHNGKKYYSLTSGEGNFKAASKDKRLKLVSEYKNEGRGQVERLWEVVG